MKRDDHGTALTKTIQSATEPMTASELRDAVGCSRQRVYTWLQANAPRLVDTGKDANGATRYVWAQDGAGGSVTIARGNRSDARVVGVGGATGAGMTMQVTGVLVEGGEVVLVLVGQDGSVFHARPAP